MKIAIDISPIIYGTGVSIYTKNLVENLLKIDSENDYFLFGGSLRRKGELVGIFKHSFDSKFSNVSSKFLPIAPKVADFIWNRVHVFKIERIIGKIDVFHSSDWTQPPTSAFKVTTIHDMVPIKFPKLTNPALISVHKARLNWVIKEVDRVIVPSKSTAKDVVQAGIPIEAVRIIPEAPDPRIKPAERSEIDKLKAKYGISRKYLLAIGVNPRKNTGRIIKAFRKLKKDAKIELIIIGHQHAKFEKPSGVSFLGHIPENELATFYTGAEVLVYPSLYEGFGIPILESFTCKTPVVTSNIGSMAEVAGDAAVLVDPNDVDAIAKGVLEALRNKEKLVKLGLRRVKVFSWEKAARKTLKVYQEAK